MVSMLWYAMAAMLYTPLLRGFDTFHGLYVGEEEGEEMINLQREKTEHLAVGKKKAEMEKAKRKRAKQRKVRRRTKLREWNKAKRRQANQRASKRSRQVRVRRAARERGWRRKRGEEGGGGRRRKGEEGEGGREEGRLSSSTYSARAVELISAADPATPFFLYLSLFTKSYPREVGRGGGQAAVAAHRRGKLEAMDRAVEEVVGALHTSGQYNHTLILFISDNGGREWADPALARSNLGLRGGKGAVWEGGARVPALLHAPALLRGGTRYQGLLHMVDLLPTLLAAAGATAPAGLDGVSQWAALAGAGPAPRNTIVYNIDDSLVPSMHYIIILWGLSRNVWVIHSLVWSFAHLGYYVVIFG